ncbi:MAG: hypothetical protein PHN84_15110 [Desulfuromonadaceae bacterium]|nr:hypothetical protein [Desulfuromonadaceae bacterium]MDD2855624.1 hypothetical protein [Desulfuromonadaceae bacterium]
MVNKKKTGDPLVELLKAANPEALITLIASETINFRHCAPPEAILPSYSARIPNYLPDVYSVVVTESLY